MSDALVDINHKRCSRCRLPRHRIDDFHRDRNATDGRATICKTCKRKARENLVKNYHRNNDPGMRQILRLGSEADLLQQVESLKGYCDAITGPSAMQTARESIHVLNQAVSNIEHNLAVWEQNQEETPDCKV